MTRSAAYRVEPFGGLVWAIIDNKTGESMATGEKRYLARLVDHMNALEYNNHRLLKKLEDARNGETVR